MKIPMLALILLSAAHAALAADDARAPRLSFATIAQGQAILTRRDDFVQRLSEFDRAARLKTSKPVSEATYRRFVANNVLEWSAAEKSLANEAIQNISSAVRNLSDLWPPEIVLIKTSGNEEGNASYTRGTAIVLNAGDLAKADVSFLANTLAHELFHVLSRSNPVLRDRLYEAIGFWPCGDILLPAALRPMKITNPDAPRADHCIQVKLGSETAWVTPMLIASSIYDDAKGGEFFEYLQLKFLVVKGPPEQKAFQATYDAANPKFVSTNEMNGFSEQIGRNTTYIIHPEEILADNFRFLVMGRRDLPSKSLQDKLLSILQANKSAH
jgi:hypothetical protein